MGRRKTISKGFDKSRKNGYFIRVAGKKVGYYPSKTERDEAFVAKQAEVEAFGFTNVNGLSSHDRTVMADMKHRAKEAGGTVLAIFNRGLEYWDNVNATIEVPVAVEDFCTSLDQRLKDHSIRRKTVSVLKSTLRTFAAHVGRIPVISITQEIADKFSTTGDDPSAQTKFNRVAIVATFCSWLVEKKMLPRNPIKRPRAPRGRPKIYQAELVHRILRRAETHYRDLLGILILQWFVGVRPSASHGMCWEDIDFERRRIIVPADFSKSGEPEIIDEVPDVAWTWLELLRGKGRIANGYHMEDYQMLKRDLGILKTWPQDVARHTYASHLYGLTGSIDRVANALLHHTTRVTLKHYVAFGIKKPEAETYFSFPPATGRQRRRRR